MSDFTAEGPPLSRVWYRVKRNPVLVFLFALAAVEALVAAEVTWRQPVIVGLGLIIRVLTSPAFEVEDDIFSAYVIGRIDGEVLHDESIPEEGI